MTSIERMKDIHRKLVYLDPGLLPIQTEALDSCGRFCGLTWERHPTSIEPLRLAIQEALTRLEAGSTAL